GGEAATVQGKADRLPARQINGGFFEYLLIDQGQQGRARGSRCTRSRGIAGTKSFLPLVHGYVSVLGIQLLERLLSPWRKGTWPIARNMPCWHNRYAGRAPSPFS